MAGSVDTPMLDDVGQWLRAFAAPTVLIELAGLLVCVGLLARYELMSLVTELEEHAGRPGHPPSAGVLLPTSHQGLPVIDGVAVPLVNNINNTRALALPQAWASVPSGL